MCITFSNRPERFGLIPLSCSFFKQKPEQFQAVIFYGGNRVPSCWGSQGLVLQVVPWAGFGEELSLFVQKSPPSPVLPACSRLLLPCRGAEDPLPAEKAGPLIFIYYFFF